MYICVRILIVMNNGRFATSMHILTLLHLHKDELLSSDYIAGSININAAIVRKEISNLKEHGLIESKEGKGGGSMLSRPAKKIWITDVYRAVQTAPLLGRKNDPNHDCPIGKQINEQLETLFTQAEDAVIKNLNKITLFDFNKQFK